MLSEQENTPGNAANWKKIRDIKCNRADSINSPLYTHFAHSKHPLFPISSIFPILTNIHEYQKEALLLKIDFCTM